MKFYGYINTDWNDQFKDELEHIKQHIEVVYNFIKDHFDNSPGDYTLVNYDSPHIYCIVRVDGNPPTLRYGLDIGVVSKFDEEHNIPFEGDVTDELAYEFFWDDVAPLFDDHNIPVDIDPDFSTADADDLMIRSGDDIEI